MRTERLSEENTGRIASIRQIAAASLLGTSIEWYYFFNRALRRLIDRVLKVYILPLCMAAPELLGILKRGAAPNRTVSRRDT